MKKSKQRMIGRDRRKRKDNAMSTNFDVNRIREDFPIFKNHPDLIYLDNSATSQKPFQVIRAVTEFYEKNNANPLRGLYDLAQIGNRRIRADKGKGAEIHQRSKSG